MTDTYFPSGVEVRPTLSVIVVCYRMTEQIGNTLRSLTPPYQRHLHVEDYEILLIDNGSPEPLPPEIWAASSNVRYEYIPPDRANPSPAAALNWGVLQSRAPVVCLMIDGARLVTPGVLHAGLRAARLCPRGIVEVRGWHLGPKVQMESAKEGYNHEVERRLLEEIQWYENGYRLFEISSLAGSTPFGFLGKTVESNCLFMDRAFFQAMGGLDERYRAPGGGLVNLDFFWRAVTRAEMVFTLLGEGHFHQVHGGAATGLPTEENQLAFAHWRVEYERLSRPFSGPPPYEPLLVGHLPKECRRWLTLEAP
ncbi:MAG: glycosyltransferase [Pirellulales bacterium]|nr:glycosyltransferase [Pirellulales bacterium]